MEKKALIVCCVVGFLGLLAAATSFAAEATRIKASQVHFVSISQCTYPRSPAMALGLIAALALMVSQIIINVATGFTFVIGFLLLLTGAALNDQRGEENVYFGYYYCYVVKAGVFAGGAILSLASAAFGILYYISLTEKKNAMQYPYPNQGVIAMAQPQIPSQTNQDPVFVHEDTYVRRQFT
ncbi:hypothetical protein V8G54_023776 [Vigna mungo]|uniref:Uncharacterized protein n=1 Tax=Vigna mungo TaxID=3915 RepID=A0AAQ3N3S1_VIGMU